MTLRKHRKSLYHQIRRIAPQFDLVDRAIAFFEFLWIHGRIPTQTLRFNDVLYNIKATNEIVHPLRVFVSDKEYLKTYVKATVGDEFNVRTEAVLQSFDDVLDYEFPPDCCIKPTHASGEVILRSAGAEIDIEKINRWFTDSYYRDTRERNYKSLRPKVIVEPIVFDDLNVTDYKIFCYQGQAKLIQLDLDRHLNHTRKFFDSAWNELEFSLAYPKSEVSVERPDNLDAMLSVAEALSSPFEFIRIDLYSDGRRCLVGEITNCHGNATERFIPPSAEDAASRLIFCRS